MSKLFNFWLNSSKEEIFISVGPDDFISLILCARSAVSSDLYLVKKESIGLCDWYGFKISDKFVIGFGMDIDDSFRYLKDIYKKV